MSQKRMIMVTERRAVANGPAAEREIIERIGIPVSRIRKTTPVILTDWTKPRTPEGEYPLLQVTQVYLGSPEDVIMVLELSEQIADLINGELEPSNLNTRCRTVLHPGKAPRPTHVCRADRGHDGDHTWEPLK